MEQPEPPEQEQMIPQQETPQLQIPIPDDAPPLPPTQEPLDMEGVEEPQSETEPIITSPEITTEVDTLDQTPDLEKPEGSESETEAKAEEPSSDE